MEGCPRPTERCRSYSEEVKEHPAATVSERGHFLEDTSGKAPNDSTVRLYCAKGRASAKKGVEAVKPAEFCRAARSVTLATYIYPNRHCFRGRGGRQHLAIDTVGVVAVRPKGLPLGTWQPGTGHHVVFNDDD